MPLTTFIPPIGPSSGTSMTPTVKILKTEFGDGYTQAAPDGLNHIKEKLDLNWSGLTETQMRQIIGFLTARRGVEPFYFQPAGSENLKWTCAEWGKSLDNSIWKVTAVFEQSFSLEV